MHGKNCKFGGSCTSGKRIVEVHILGGAVVPMWGQIETLVKNAIGRPRRLSIVRAIECHAAADDKAEKQTEDLGNDEDDSDEDSDEEVLDLTGDDEWEGASSSSKKRRSSGGLGKGKKKASPKQSKRTAGSSASSSASSSNASGSSGLSAEASEPRECRACIGINISNLGFQGLPALIVQGLRDGMAY